jgi:hypothetical protein
MRVSTAYFAGAGTVVVAIAAGLGGGLLLGDIMSPQQPKHPSSEVTRLEQRAAPQPIPAMAGASQPVPYTAATQVANTAGEQAAPPQPQQAPSQPAQQTQPQLQQASTKAAEPPKPQPERSSAAQSASVQPSAPAEQTVARAAPEESYAKARDADLKREDRRAEDKRKSERRKQWTDKRKWREHQDGDLNDVEASVREVTESRPVFGREQRVESREQRYVPRERDTGFFGREQQRYERRDPGFGRGGFNLFDD